ncbi:MAG: leucine--tRNA ligase [Flavobacterium sp.]
MKYNPSKIEAKWQKYWAENQTFQAENKSDKPKYYVLDMFPYPSGAGLHVGHPLGYIASDIIARYKRHEGFNVLHPQGYDSFGLPAEQYAIQTGQHPDKTTKENIARYREQLDKIGFSFDWSREVRTSDASYYKWTQWIFTELFNSWYCKDSDQAKSIDELQRLFSEEGNSKVNAVSADDIPSFTANDWNAFSESEKQKMLLNYRMTYLAETEVNWCPGLGTVLANDEIVNGVSERGGFPVMRKKMTQWSMRISAYAERLLQGLNDIDWSESIKESQRNWIGKSVGAMVTFPILSFPKGEAKAIAESSRGYMTGGNNSHLTIEHAKDSRKNPTEAEAFLWEEIRNKKIGYKFRQQHLIEDYIVDFVCLSKGLIIEVDGGYHFTPEQKQLDDERTLKLNQKGYEVIRFTNEQVLNDTEQVLKDIRTATSTRHDFCASAPLSFGEGSGVRIFTTRPDTIFGATFLTLAPEHELVEKITTEEQKEAVAKYIETTSKRSERERMADVKTISGVFTGSYAEHPFTKEAMPIWIGDYVLAGYGTGAVMAVPCGDDRDFAFANHFRGEEGMPAIANIFKGISLEDSAYGSKEGFVLENSDFLNGLAYKEATAKVIEELEDIDQGFGKINYRLRDAVFSRQRYWGEPFPVYYKDGLPQMIAKEHLPIRLPEVEKYLPTEDGKPPLGNATVWAWDTVSNSVVDNNLIDEQTVFALELNTMPGWAGSSWYWLRYMDPHNMEEFVSPEAENYWQGVDLYIGGSEHATGHLLYSRFWNKFLKDKGYVHQEEPFKKLINQGMILGMSAFVYRWEYSTDATSIQGNRKTVFFSKSLIEKAVKNREFITECNEQAKDVLNIVKIGNKNFRQTDADWSHFTPIHVDLAVINDITNELDIEAFKNHPLYSDYKNAEFILEDGKYIVGREVEKMSKSKYNVVNPDDICNEYGADTLRLYEMFLGPLEQAKPWNTAGITGVFGFLKKLWRLYFDDSGFIVTADPASAESLKSLHKTIKKVQEDISTFSFNTSVSSFMICVNELTAQGCHNRSILEPLAVLISPYAPHIAEELWSSLGHQGSISAVAFPIFNEAHLVENSKEYPVSFNGKMRFLLELPLTLTKDEIEAIVLADERTIKQLDGRTPNKIIIVPGKIINLVG